MVKNEGIFMPFWLKHYTKFFEPQDLFVHSDSSTDDTEAQCRAAGVNFIPVPYGRIQVGQNDKYIKGCVTALLEHYDCVLFAESPDDIITPGPVHGYDLKLYLNEFRASREPYRFLTGINIIQHRDEAPYDRSRPLLAQRRYAVRCPQYDNAFLWSVPPMWGKGWHDLGGGRLEGMGDEQGEDKRLYNLHIHYADFDLANARHHVRQRTYAHAQREAYMSRVDSDLRDVMTEMIEKPSYWFSNGCPAEVESWMAQVI